MGRGRCSSRPARPDSCSGTTVTTSRRARRDEASALCDGRDRHHRGIRTLREARPKEDGADDRRPSSWSVLSETPTPRSHLVQRGTPRTWGGGIPADFAVSFPMRRSRVRSDAIGAAHPRIGCGDGNAPRAAARLGYDRLSLRWTERSRGFLDQVEARGWASTSTGPDLGMFLEASLLLPASVTADFEFPGVALLRSWLGSGGSAHEFPEEANPLVGELIGSRAGGRA